jgi:hypothetical protein
VATTRVFVDDAVRGDLPDLCVKDGVPAGGGRLTLTEEVTGRGLGLWWLLVFLGPIGWIALVVVAAGSRGETLTVTLPFGTDARERYLEARRGRRTVVAVGIPVGASLLLASLLGAPPGFAVLGLVVLGVTLVAGMVFEYRIGQALVGVDLDASRRWVTLRAVHPAFARAVAESTRSPSETA